MRRQPDERGAIAFFTAAVTVALLGMGAFVIDIGALVQERRELQNGADAAALAVAKDCGAGDCLDYDATADDFVDPNALDGDSNVDEVCGDGAGLPACADPPTLPDGASGYVRVLDSTQEASSGGVQITFRLAQVLGLTGETVHASAVAAWGAPAGAITTPLTISQCEFDNFTDDGSSYATGPPFTGQPTTILFHNPTVKKPKINPECPVTPAGQDDPGGFGWLDTDGDCRADTNADGTYSADTGNDIATTGCIPAEWLNTTVLIPIYDTVENPGTNAAYHIYGYAGFYVSGYKFTGGPSNTGGTTSSCGGGTQCLVGYFTRFVASGEEFGGPDLGAVIVRMIG